jgi:hypothetical protein
MRGAQTSQLVNKWIHLPSLILNVTRSPRAVCLVFTVRGRYDRLGGHEKRRVNGVAKVLDEC